MKYMNHNNITEPAHKALAQFLEARGNVLSADHSAALRGLLALMTDMATGKHRGRLAAGLDTGLGKSSSINHWLAAVHGRVPPQFRPSVAVAAERVESLCEMKRDLMRLGVMEEHIGVVHSYRHWAGEEREAYLKRHPEHDPEVIPPGYASEPANKLGTVDFVDRPIMLVSHSRVRGFKSAFGDEARRPFSEYQGRPRDLMIYDESLLVSETRTLKMVEFSKAHSLLDVVAAYKTNVYAVPLSIWFKEVGVLLESLLKQLDKENAHATVRLPEPGGQSLDALEKVARGDAGLPEDERRVIEPVASTLMTMLQYELRVTRRNGGGLLQFQLVVPSELENILILDASYPIRQLMQEDGSIKDAEKVMVKDGMCLSKPMSQLKDYGSVEWHIMQASGGRSNLNKAFKAEHRLITQDVVEVVKAVPVTESVLLFVYKHKGGRNPDFRSILLQDMQAAGIDTDATVELPHPEDPSKVEVRKRINVATWGNETGANTWSHCQHVVMVGILQKDKRTLEAQLVGQRGDINTPVTPQELNEVVDSESAHFAHQAASRSCIRRIVNGKAQKAHIWAIHWRRGGLQKYLKKVQADARWHNWQGSYAGTCGHQKRDHKPTKAEGLAGKVVEYLDSLPPTTDRVSTSRARKDLKLTSVAQRTWHRSVQEALNSRAFSWTMDGRSLVRVDL